MKVFKKREKKKEINYSDIMGFDIETAGDTNEFVLACFYSEKRQYVCHSKSEVKQLLNSTKLRNYKVYATNLAFDFLGTLYEESHRWQINERQGTIYSFRYYTSKDKNGKYTKPVSFFDTMRIVPMSVKALGDIVKVPKMDHPKCFGKVPSNSEEFYELVQYCMNDARISYLFIKDIVIPYLAQYKIPLKQTIGSMAMEDYRNNHLPFPFFQEPETNREFAFKSYYGGRTETFKRGKFNDVYCFDINSLYPSVMLMKMPNPNKYKHIEHTSINYIKSYEGVSHVLVRVPMHMKIPPLPYKKDGKLLFPVGTFKGYYNHNELRNAMKYGVEILEVYDTLIYTETGYYFKDFVEKHYQNRLNMKQKGDPMQIMCKLMLNNLYGKFGFNYKKTSSVIPRNQLNYDKHIKKDCYIEPLSELNEFFSVESAVVTVPDYSFPIISSYITSYARIKMYEYLADVRIQNKIIATDTDSIFIHNYVDEISTSTQLGAMSLESGYPVKESYFVRPKFYNTNKPKCKGVKFSSESQFFDMLNNIPIKQERFVKYRTALRSQPNHKHGVLVPNQIIQVSKKVDLEDTKRAWSSDFVPDTIQKSRPLYVNHETETAELLHKQKEKDVLYSEKVCESVVDEISKMDDLVDWSAMPDDIPKEEWIQNEFLSEKV